MIVTFPLDSGVTTPLDGSTSAIVASLLDHVPPAVAPGVNAELPSIVPPRQVESSVRINPTVGVSVTNSVNDADALPQLLVTV